MGFASPASARMLGHKVPAICPGSRRCCNGSRAEHAGRCRRGKAHQRERPAVPFGDLFTRVVEFFAIRGPVKRLKRSLPWEASGDDPRGQLVAWSTTALGFPFRGNGGKVWNRRISPVAPRPREGPLTEPTAAPQPWRRERVLMPFKRPSRCLRSGPRPSRDDGQIGTGVCRAGALHDIECRDRPPKTFKLQVSEIFELYDGFNLPGDAAADQDLTILGLGTEPGGEIAHRADRGVTGAFGKAYLAQGRVALRDTRAKTKFAAVATPSSNQLTRLLRASPLPS